ncbi:hypothetical protein BCR37DRAFT_377477 [Protomyces lactucae-debilis]|uniref:OTU domain-containing protein n=1 Tax=Protomyces lactucae-debilis TaxID=2754530 RepID=A0A1Y2FP48_PROLT|nr:uncharacterized protein BCR37DRAFT_377477 [Protomyces lactucae-debilis]ORY85761.1 hypothetical protein BCR37DRAFT_377477 [Protomyces lactucae-debilis]
MSEQSGKRVNKAKARLQRRAEAMEAQRQEAREEVSAMPDHKSIEASKVASKVKARSLEEFDIKADGHCLYSAFADQLGLHRNLQVDYKELRKQTASFIREHSDDFSPFLQFEAGEPVTVEAYAKEIEETARWGGEMEILALARKFEVSVSVVQAAGDDLVYEGKHETKLSLARYQHMYSLGAHFNSLRPMTRPITTAED